MSQRSRCAIHTTAERSKKQRTAAEQQQARDLRQQWVLERGLLCPGYNRPEHPVDSIDDLTLDHIVPWSQGGRNGPVAILCRSCNSAKGTR